MDHQPVYVDLADGVRWPLERAVVLALWITCIVVLPVLVLVFYVVRRSNPGRFRLSATLLKLVSINIEADAQEKPGELPGNRPGPGGILRRTGPDWWLPRRRRACEGPPPAIRHESGPYRRRQAPVGSGAKRPLHLVGEPPPRGRGEPQHRAGTVLGVPHQHAVTVVAGSHLDAVTRRRIAALDPLQ